MTGLALWADAGRNVRELFIRVACDADFRAVAPPSHGLRRLTVAQALEVVGK